MNGYNVRTIWIFIMSGTRPRVCPTERGRRVGFEAKENSEWETAVVTRSDRQGEVRWAATGYIGGRLHRVVYIARKDRTRIISLRIANRKEEREYAGA